MYKNIKWILDKSVNLITFIKSNTIYSKFWYLSNIYQIYISKNFKSLFINIWDLSNTKTLFIPTFYVRNEYIWQDGFLFDFLQKKTADAWVRRFVIYTGFIFSERLVFDSVVRIYIDNLIWTLHYFSIFELNNVSEMLLSIIYLYITLIFLLLTTIIL